MSTNEAAWPDDDRMNEHWLALALAPGVTRHRLDSMLTCTDDAAAVRTASQSELKAAGLSEAAINALRHPDEAALQRSLKWLEQPHHHLIPCTDDRYPELLQLSGHAPLCLFVAGNPDTLGLPQLAIVGSRNATPAGCETAHEFAAHLARCGFTITSGLALGIDTAAHTGALEAGGKPVSVEGTGLDEVYPRANTDMAERITLSGARVSEFAPGTRARRDSFPRRNRIIAGLSVGTLVVEAGRTSGALITARYSGDCGREVFAIPGSIHNPLSKGCHRLIRQGAKLVETADDILEELAHLVSPQRDTNPTPAAATAPADDPDPEYMQLLQSLGHEPTSIDRLAGRSGLTAEKLSSMLLILELQGKVRTLPGGRFQKR